MSTDALLILLFVALTVIAYMIAINAKGLWRSTISFLLATCMLGGTVWLIILQYSTHEKRTNAAIQATQQMDDSERQRASAEIAKAIVSNAKEIAETLINVRLQNDNVSHDALVARASQTQRRFDDLQTDVDNHRRTLAKFPKAQKHLAEAMRELKEACGQYYAYYFASSTAAEQALDRRMRQHARTALAALTKADAEMSGEEAE